MFEQINSKCLLYNLEIPTVSPGNLETNAVVGIFSTFQLCDGPVSKESAL